MGMHEGRAQLAEAMKQLHRRWLDAQFSWNDSRSKDFQENVLQPLEKDIRAALGAMDQMAALLSRIQQDCT